MTNRCFTDIRHPHILNLHSTIFEIRFLHARTLTRIKNKNYMRVLFVTIKEITFSQRFNSQEKIDISKQKHSLV